MLVPIKRDRPQQCDGACAQQIHSIGAHVGKIHDAKCQFAEKISLIADTPHPNQFVLQQFSN
jgi:hypothetical protein